MYHSSPSEDFRGDEDCSEAGKPIIWASRERVVVVVVVVVVVETRVAPRWDIKVENKTRDPRCWKTQFEKKKQGILVCRSHLLFGAI
jgi:hypothetical protein